MQHIVNIFLGDKLVSFRDKFAAYYRQADKTETSAYFSALSLTKNDIVSLVCDLKGDKQDNGKFEDNEDLKISLINYFEDLFRRKVTITHQGNRTLAIILWCTLYEENQVDFIRLLLESIKGCKSSIITELICFTNEAVSCFVPDSADRRSPDYYRNIYDKNIKDLLGFRPLMSSLILFENCNYHGVSLNFNEDNLARVGAEYVSLLNRNYLNLRETITDIEFPLESFGLSSVKFDRQYFINYLRNKLLIERISQENINDRVFNINSLATRTNKLLEETKTQIKNLRKITIDAKANLDTAQGSHSQSELVGAIDQDIEPIISNFTDNLKTLLEAEGVTFFEREALMSLILGEDCSMFDSSAVRANEHIVDDIIDDSIQFFINFDGKNRYIKKVSISKIKELRNQMRNIAIANRQRNDELEELGVIKDNQKKLSHITDNKYEFDGVNYNLNLEIDKEPLDIIYQPHPTNKKSVDLRSDFGKIRSQGEQGSCSAFAVSSVIETLLNDHTQISPAFLYYNARALDNVSNTDAGTSIYNILKVAMEKGACSEKLMPYNDKVYDLIPSHEVMEDAGTRKVIEAQSIDLSINPLSTLKSALEDGFPVIIASRIFDSFSDTLQGFVSHPSSEELKEKGRSDGHGKHAMVVCGYSDDEKVFVVRNSWGEDFGDKGYCYIPYSYAEKYFLQACIITKISESSNNKVRLDSNHILSFDVNDAEIKQAILQNLIEEDKLRLEKLTKESDKLKSIWSKNEGVLGNVNNQTNLIDEECKRFDEEIESVRKEKEEKENQFMPKIKKYKLKWLKRCLILPLPIIISLIIAIGYSNIVTWSIFSIFLLIELALIAYAYGKWRFYRQDLRNEIEQFANSINQLKKEKGLIHIKSHVYGTILKRFITLRNKLQNEKLKIKLFNNALVECFNESSVQIKSLKPEMPYPFLCVFNNESIDCYFENRKNRLIEALDLNVLYENYDSNRKILDQVKNNPEINDILNLDVSKFAMKLMFCNTDRNKWQFLPRQDDLGAIIPDLCERAMPFCSTQANFENCGSYIIFEGANSEILTPARRFFANAPVPIDDKDKDSITILNVARFNISQ